MCLAALFDGLVIAVHRSGAHVAGHGSHPLFLAQTLLVVVVAGCLLTSARFPLFSWRIAYLVVLFGPLLRTWVPRVSRWDPASVALLAIVFAMAGLWQRRPVLCWMAALMLVPVWLWSGPDWVTPVGLTAGVLVLTVAVDVTGAWRRDRQALTVQTERAELEGARRAVLEDRARIARELHDVVAHHLSLMAVQAETAPYRLRDVPEPVRAEFGELSGAAREALAEMRRLLGVLRSDRPAERVPQPRLADVPDLVSGARRAGARVSLSMPSAGTAPVPAGIGVCAYRIVQESLSNAARHSPGAPISVSVATEPRFVRIKVTNGPPAAPAAADSGRRHGEKAAAGHGLAGMRERVAMLGGSLSAGPDAGGGFAVSAELPVGEAAR
jgi:signal transduction histidine kinase